jgi:nitroimidazol reductase NimA-like FMN-containing flavoprotein (pyridoxamine 5'-phosphate oxidase superfamily)
MFKDMRNSKRQVTREESLEILKAGEYGVFSTLGSDGYPYGVPVSYVLLNDSIYFHCAMEGNKLDNIRHEAKVSFNVVGSTELVPERFTTKYESVIVYGRAEEISSKEEKIKVLLAIIEKYSQDFLEEGKAYIDRAVDKTHIVKINIEHISGKANR